MAALSALRRFAAQRGACNVIWRELQQSERNVVIAPQRIRDFRRSRVASVQTYSGPASATTATPSRSTTDHLSSSTVLPENDIVTNSDVGGLYRLLNDEQRQLLHEQRSLTAQVQQIVAEAGLPMDNAATSLRLASEENASFMLLVVGEFNAGKSSLLNAILGRELLATGVLPTTDCWTVIGHANDAASANKSMPNVQYHAVSNVSLLQDLTLVDTPGTNALHSHTEQTLQLVPRADLILFVTNADRPLAQSEHDLLRTIARWHKPILLVVNKMDVLDTAGGRQGAPAKARILQHVQSQAGEILGHDVPTIGVSARDGLVAQLHGNDALWERSRLGDLLRYLQTMLTTPRKVMTKLSSPVGTAQARLNDISLHVQRQQHDLQQDVQTLQLLKSQLQGWRRELALELEQARRCLHSAVVQHGARWCNVLRRHATITVYGWCLRDRARLQREYDKTGSDGGQQVLRATLQHMTHQTADHVATVGRTQGQALVEFLGQRPVMHHQSLVGNVTHASRYAETRDQIVQNWGNVVDAHVYPNDELDELQNVVSNLQYLAYATACLHASAVASFLTFAVQLSTEATLPLGLAVLLAGAGHGVFHAGAASIARRHERKWTQTATQLDQALQAPSAHIMTQVDRRVQAGVAPYTRFIEAEQERLAGLQQHCQEASVTARRLRNRLKQMQEDDEVLLS